LKRGKTLESIGALRISESDIPRLIFLGDGFLLSHAEKEKLVDADQRNQKIIAPVINGEDVSSDPKQAPAGTLSIFQSH